MTTVIPFPTAPEPARWGDAQADLTPEQVASAEAAAEVGYAWRQQIERKQRVPVWLRDPAEAVAAARFYVGGWWHALGFHTLRLPKYWCRIMGRSPAGLKAYASTLRAVVLDSQGMAERKALTAALGREGTGATALAGVIKAHRRGVLGRIAGALVATVLVGWLALGLFGFLASQGAAVVGMAPLPRARLAGSLAGVALGLGLVLGVLGWHGRPPDQRVRDWAVDRDDGPPPLTQELILRALAAIGISALTKAIEADVRNVEFRGVPHRQGNGVRVEVDLPPGVTASQVIERRDKLASALRHPLGCVWPEAAPEVHEGRLILYVASTALAQAKHGPWPLAAKGRADVFEPMPVGHNQRGELVTVTLAFNSGVIGAIPRMGKTFLLRLIGLIFGLDPRARLYVYDLKGAGDLKPLAKVAHRYGVGDDDETVRQALADLTDLQADMRKRYEQVRNLPPDVCPESKVTPELAGRRSLGLYPVAVLADEIQLWFEHPTYGKELEAVVTDLVKRGPAVLICVWLATQRPDAKSLPTAIRDNVSIRFALKVQTHTANDMILGTGAHSAGVTAVQLLNSDKGVAVMVGEGAPCIVRTPAVTVPEANGIMDRAAAARLAAGWQPTGYAAGEALPSAEPDAGVSVLEDCRDIWLSGAAGMTFEQLAARLAEHRPGTYGTWGVPQVSAALRSHGLPVVNVRDGKRSPKGVKHDALLEALARLLDGGSDA